jgi:uncharacterized protein YlzI (FlbEa/FlbD family)
MIELTGKNGRKVLVNPAMVACVDSDPQGQCSIFFVGYNIQVKESYVEIKGAIAARMLK